jgi:hypothetical protein
MAGISPIPVSGGRRFYVGEKGGGFGARDGEAATTKQETERDMEKSKIYREVESSEMFLYTTYDFK